MENGKYYLVKGYGVFNCTIVRAGKPLDDDRQVCYLGRCRIIVRKSEVVREASKEEGDPRNGSKLRDEVFGNI